MTTLEMTPVAVPSLAAEGEPHLFGLICEPVGAAIGTVLLAPGYERQIRNLCVQSRTLNLLGYRTLRWDFRNHLGLSSGEIADLTMGSMAEDIGAAVAWSAARWPGEPVFLFAASLAARSAVRSLATTGAALTGYCALLPVVDARETMKAVSGIDCVEEVISGRVAPSDLVLANEHYVSYAFAETAHTEGWGGVAECAEEVKRIEFPCMTIAGAQDEWVRLEDVLEVLPAYTHGEHIVLDATSHSITKNPAVLREITQQMADFFARCLDRDPTPIPQLGFDEVRELVTTERAWWRAGYATCGEQ